MTRLAVTFLITFSSIMPIHIVLCKAQQKYFNFLGRFFELQFLVKLCASIQNDNQNYSCSPDRIRIRKECKKFKDTGKIRISEIKFLLTY